MNKAVSSSIQGFFFILVWLVATAVAANESPRDRYLGQPVVQVFQPEAFQGNATNWFVQQNEHGIIFLSNGYGLFSFDGAHWHQQLSGQNIRQFALADKGRIYIAAEGEFGYLDPLDNGEYQYHSLLKQLPAADREISDVNNVFAFEGRVYFFAPEQIMVVRPQQGIEVIKPEFRFSRAWLTPDKLFFNDGRELRYFERGEIHPIPSLDSSKITGFGFVQKIAPQSYILGTFSKGIYLWQDHSIQTLLPVQDPLAGKGFFNSLRLDENRFAVATIRDGVYIFNHRAEVLYHLDTDNGLPVNTVVNLFLDRQQGLWLPMEGQLARVQLPFDLSVFPARQFNINKVKRLAFLQDKLYLSAVNGVRAIDADGKMEMVEQAVNSAAVVLRYQDTLLIGGAGKCQQIDTRSGEVITLLRSASCKDIRIASAQGQDFLLMLNERGLWASRREQGQWAQPELFYPETQISSLLVQDDRGDFWTSTASGEVVRLYFDGQWRGESHPASQASITVLGWRERILVATDQGLHYWDRQQARPGPAVPWFEQFFGADAATPDYVYEDSSERLWVGSEDQSGYLQLQNGAAVSWHPYPVAASGLHSLRVVMEQEDVYWLGFDDGLARYRPRAGEDDPAAALVVTRISEVGSERILQQSLMTSDISQVSVAEPGQRLKIEFALSSYLHSYKNRYRYRLDEGPWSEWDDRATLTLQQPFGGTIALQIQARDFQSRLFDSIPLRLVFAAPWYATPLAFVLYGLILLLLIWQLANRFAEMKTRKLREQQALLEAEVEQRTEKIRQQAEQLQQLSEAKSRFFANVSHEFRTPLTLAIGPLEALRNDPSISSEEARQHIRIALENSRRMLTLVGQILDINRLEHGEMKLAVHSFELQPALQKIVQPFSVLAQQRQLTLQLEIAEPVRIWFDEDHLYKIVSNLLSNAVKFSPDGGQICLQVEKLAQQRVQISISDEGPGIDPSEREQLFQRFFQGKNSSNNLQPGTGIGLAMVRELLELHHGSIELDESWQAGSRFVVTILTGKAHYSASDLLEFQTVDAPPMVRQDEPTEVVALVAAATDSDDSTPPEHRPAVLIVDDNADLRAFIRTTLASAYHCFEAANGLLALEMLQQHSPDFIICDVMMPQMDGIEFTRQLKADVETAHIPLLLLTAKATKRDTVHGLQQGADDYLTKPFDSSELIARIEAHLQQKQHISRAIYQKFIATLPAPANDDDADSFECRFHQLVSDHISDSSFDIAAMSEALHMERSTLFRKVRKAFDCTPNQYLKSQRLKMALQMLRQNSGSISEIAYAVGFQSLNYFSRSFRDQYQVSPSAHQKIRDIA